MSLIISTFISSLEEHFRWCFWGIVAVLVFTNVRAWQTRIVTRTLMCSALWHFAKSFQELAVVSSRRWLIHHLWFASRAEQEIEQGFPTWGARTPWGCEMEFQGVLQRVACVFEWQVTSHHSASCQCALRSGSRWLCCVDSNLVYEYLFKRRE